MESVVRAFIAIDLSADIHEKLKQVIQKLKDTRRAMPVRWAAVEGIHLTLKFLGDVPITNLDNLKKITGKEANKVTPFEVSMGGLGAFPTLRRPRVIIVKVQAPAELAALQNGIEEEARRLGFPREDRPFTPHLTLGRVARLASNSDVQRIGEVVESMDVVRLGLMPVQAVVIYRSVLQPGGAIYTPLFSARLKPIQPDKLSQ